MVLHEEMNVNNIIDEIINRDKESFTYSILLSDISSNTSYSTDKIYNDTVRKINEIDDVE